MQKDKKYYDEFFKKYPADVHDNYDRFSAVARILSGRVIDVACGTGTLAKYYSGDYIGVDISDSAISSARSLRRKNARFLQADFTKNTFTINEKFDCAYIGEFLEHILDDSVVFSNLKNLLKNDALIVVSVPNGERVPDESHCRTFTVPQIRRDYSKYGKLTFHNWIGFKDRILFSIKLGEINQNLITLVIMAKNEENGIENCIISALPCVDRVLVSVDTKTTDKTAQIAKLYADELVSHEFKDDFSLARNYIQKFVKSKWTLFLDGHEYIEKTGEIESLLDHDIDGILVTIRMENGTSFMYPRIFRSHLRFENAVHNAVDVKSKVYAPNFVIVHDRINFQSKDSSLSRQIQRDKMIPENMAQVLKKNPQDQRALFNLANWHMTKSNFKEALKFYKLCYAQTPSADERYFIKAQIGIAYQLLGKKLRATFSFFDLENLIPNRWETKRLIGGIYLDRGQYKKAVEYFVFALSPNEKQYLYQLFKHDIVELWDLIGMCFFELRYFEKAIIAFRQAKKETSEKLRKDFFETKVQLCELSLKKN